MVKDLTLVLRVAIVDNRYATARSRSAGSVFFVLRLFLLLPLEIVFAKGVLVTSVLLPLFVLGLCTALAMSGLAALEIVAVEGILLLLFLDLLVAVVVVILKRLIDELDNTNGLKNGLQRKLAAISDMTNLGEYTCNKAYAINISKIASAIKEQKQIILKNYSSAHSNTVSNHIVEPFEFTSNQIDIWAYDTQDCLNKRFKISRIEETEILDSDWSNKQFHKSETIDDFRTHGNDKHHVLLELDYLAKNLLIEEYPLAEKHITAIGNDNWLYEADVNKLDGVGRFALGLTEHIKVLKDDALISHIINSAKNILNNQ